MARSNELGLYDEPHGSGEHNNEEYRALVQDDKKTCSACPTQWEGTLKDGRSFYFRYRWGKAYLGVADTIDNAVWVGDKGGVKAFSYLGHALDGVLDDDEYRRMFVELHGQLA